jgi:hypothetical protein
LPPTSGASDRPARRIESADQHGAGGGPGAGHAEFTDIPTIVDGRLDPFLEKLQKEIYEVSDEVEAHFFRAGTDLQLHFQRWA